MGFGKAIPPLNVILTSTVADAAAGGNNTWTDLTSLTLTPGVWDIYVSAACRKDTGASTWSLGIGTVSGDNAPGSGVQGADFTISTGAAASYQTALAWHKLGVSVSASTIYYMKLKHNSNSGAGGGIMSARLISR